MGDLGFWALAHEHPEHLALVAPDGTEYTSAALLGRANQVVHGLRGLNLQPGDVVATLLPNGVEMFELYLAALQAGWYLVPINHHLIGPEVAYILSDSGAKAFVAHERFADVALDAAEEAELPSSICFAVGDIPGFGSYARMRDNQPTTDPDEPDHRRRHELHVGHHRQPQGRVPAPERALARGGRARPVGHPLPVRHPATGRQRPHRRLAAVPHGRPALLGRLDPSGPHPGAHGQVAARGDAPAHRGVPGHHVAHGPHPVPPAAGPARGDPGRLRRVLAAPHDPRRRPVPGRRQAPDDRLVGRRHRRVLRRVRGRGDPGDRPGVADQAGHRREGVAHLRDRHLRRRGRPGSRSRT